SKTETAPPKGRRAFKDSGQSPALIVISCFIKGFLPDDRQLQGLDDLSAFQRRFVLELQGNL
ncbi:hypothetical protein, partial [Acetobacter papayae]|uniref:hypothetical protein n=1 Tax=Acetobacter papayae TaxID=1076592 RepID=UPI001F3003A6